MADLPERPKELPKGDVDQPSGPVRRDVTGTATPQDLHVDPDNTEGHPGYDESGQSELTPPREDVKNRSTPQDRSRQ